MRLAAVQRQVGNLALVYQLAASGRPRRHQLGVRRYRNALGDAAHFERDRLVGRLVHRQPNAFLDVGRKTLLLHRQPVPANRERWEDELADLARDGGLDQAGIHVLRLHGSLRNRPAAGVQHRAAQTRRGVLRIGRQCADGENDK